MSKRSVYLILLIAGILLPYSQFLPWIAAHGLDLPRFFSELFINRISTFFAADVLISAVVTLVFAGYERTRIGAAWWIPVVATLIIGVSAGLPLVLWLRERKAA